MTDVKFELNRDSSAWRDVFLHNGEIRAALVAEGQRMADMQAAKTGEPQDCDIRVLRNTQVARIRPSSERLSDDEAAERRRKAASKGRKKYWRNKRK